MKFPVPSKPVDWVAWLECCDVVDALDTDFDPSAGANHYYSLPIGREPSWAPPERLTLEVGKLRF